MVAAMNPSVVVRAPNWVGDMVMATPMLLRLAQSEAFREVRILARAQLAPILKDSPLEARVVTIQSDAEELDRYRELRPDIALLYSNSLGAAWRAFRARVPMRAGARLSGRSWLLTHAVSVPSEDGRRVAIPTAHLLRDITGLLGVTVADLHPRLWVREEIVDSERARLERLGLAAGTGYVLCCPGAAYGSAKLWPPERFARALDLLRERHGLRAVVSGGPGEEALIAAVVRASASEAISLSAEPRTLESLKALVQGARLVLVGDSGPRWYAAAFDVPCVSVMGPNAPELTASSLEHARIVRRTDLDCAPCLRKHCPLGHHACLRGLGVEAVVQAAEELLSCAKSC
jgi:heptosyltransferase-2